MPRFEMIKKRVDPSSSQQPVRPWLLQCDNFTPPSRTPWGGTRIHKELKAHLSLSKEKANYRVVGESWEISVEPDFPSGLEGIHETLDELIRNFPKEFLGTANHQASTSLLVKLLDTAQALSVQIHPRDTYANLRPLECGKPESWYVVDRSPAAGFFLGFKNSVSKDDVRDAIETSADLSPFLFFVDVEPGDFFLIEPGLAHAIGSGITLVEPQRVQPGCRGVTYRYWDWNRRYDDEGNLDANGKPRPLHITESLDVTDWRLPREQSLLMRIRVRAGKPDVHGAPTLEPLCGPLCKLQSPDLEISRLFGTGQLRLDSRNSLRALTLLEGVIQMVGDTFDMTVSRGQSIVLPAALPSIEIELRMAHAILSNADL